MTTNKILDRALELIALGISVIPIKTDGSKRPAIPAWRTYQEKVPSEEAVRAWFTNHPDAGIAVVLGEVSGGLECVDFDSRSSYGTWRDDTRASGLAETVRDLENGFLERSPNGYHLLWRSPVIEGSRKLAQEPDGDDDRGRQKYKTLIETRGDRAYVIVAPSGGKVHQSGQSYEIVKGSFSTIASISEEVRASVLSVAQTQNRRVDQKPMVEHKVVDSSGDLRPGDDFGSRVGWEEILAPHGWRHLFSSGGQDHWCRPGKQHGVSATTNHAGTDLLYVFSSSTNFEPNRGISKFSAYAQLEHGGDFAAASRQLRADGYGGVAGKQETLLARVSMDSIKAALHKKLDDLHRVKQIEQEDDEGIWKTIDQLGQDWLGVEPPPRRYLFERDGVGAIPHEKVGLLVAPGARGKTMALIQMAISIVTGRSWLGTFQPVRQGYVAVALAEEDEEEIRRRIWSICVGLRLSPEEREDVGRFIVPLGMAGHPVALVHRKGGVLENSETHLSIMEQLTAREYVALILDPLSRWAPDCESDNASATAAIQAFELFCQAPGRPSVIIAHHTGKQSRREGNTGGAVDARGVTGLTDAARWASSLGGKGEDDITFQITKSNYSPYGDKGPLPLTRENGVLRPLTLDEELSRAQKGPQAQKETGLREQLLLTIRAMPGCSTRHLRDSVVGFRSSTVQSVLSSMVESGHLVCQNGPNRGHHYFLSEKLL